MAKTKENERSDNYRLLIIKNKFTDNSVPKQES
jgi:hypothetical protein